MIPTLLLIQPLQDFGFNSSLSPSIHSLSKVLVVYSSNSMKPSFNKHQDRLLAQNSFPHIHNFNSYVTTWEFLKSFVPIYGMTHSMASTIKEMFKFGLRLLTLMIQIARIFYSNISPLSLNHSLKVYCRNFGSGVKPFCKLLVIGIVMGRFAKVFI